MKKLLITTVVTGVFISTAWAGGPANKVTGDFMRDNGSRTWLCEISAHEMKDNRHQKGYIYCEEVGTTNYWTMDLNPAQACVNVIDDTTALIAGYIGSGTDSAVGGYWGFEIVDEGEPGYGDTFVVYPLSSDNVDNFCADNYFDTKYEYWLTDGNIQVHFHDR